MNYVPVVQSRKQRKRKRGTDKKRYGMILPVVLGATGLYLVFLKTAAALEMKLLTAILILFAAICFLIWSILELCRKAAVCIKNSNHSEKMVEKADVLHEASGRKKFRLAVEAGLSVLAWGFFLYVLQPFITALLWWQSYQLMAGRTYPVTIVSEVFAGIEYGVYLGMFVCLLQILWKEWSQLTFGKES